MPPPAGQHLQISQLQAILAMGAYALSILTALGASALVVPKLVLQARLRGAEGRARVAEGALGDVSLALGELRQEVRELRLDVAGLRRVQIISSRYIASLISHIRSRRPASEMPPLPPELADDVLAELRAREADAHVDIEPDSAAAPARV
ncbi:MAG: hypothetical protein ABSD03_16245 [Vulcanimicrobiaceae bacterium]|jgi:hypothetical protein